MLSAINRKLSHYPELAAGLAEPVVKDCAGAAAFVEAYERRQLDEPGFDDAQPPIATVPSLLEIETPQ